MNNAQVIEILQNFNGILIQNEWFNTFIRWLGWLIIKGLASLVNTFENVLGKITGLTTFFNSPGITKLINSFKPVMFGFLALSLCYIAYQLLLNKKFEKRAIPTNIIIAITVVILLPSAMLKLNELTQAGVKAVYGDFNSIANEVIDNNITDIYLYDDINFSKKDIKPKNNIPKSKITTIEINETIDKSKTKNEKVFENKVVYKKDGGYDLKRIDGLFKWDNQYYRWKCNFWVIIISLLTTAITIILTSIKITRLIFELAFNKVFAIIFAFSDIAHGQRLKKTIKNIISIFAVIFCMALMLKIYLIFGSWIEAQNLGILGILVTVGMSIAVIDGPNIVEQIFGIDAGLNSAWKTIAGLYAGTRAANELTKGFTRAGMGLSKFMASTGDKVANGVAGAMGFGAGAKEGIKNNNLEKQMKDDKNKVKTKGKSDSANSLEKQMKDEGINLNNTSLRSEDIHDKNNDKLNGKLSEKGIENNSNSMKNEDKDKVNNKGQSELKDKLSDIDKLREPLEESSSTKNLESDRNTSNDDDINSKSDIDELNSSNNILKDKEMNDVSKSAGIQGKDEKLNLMDNLNKQKLSSDNRGLGKESLSRGENSELGLSSNIKPGESNNPIDRLDKQGLNTISTNKPISESINSGVGAEGVNQSIEKGLNSSSNIKPGESINSIDSLDKQGLGSISTSKPISQSINSGVGAESINQSIESGSSSSSSIKPGESIGSRKIVNSVDNFNKQGLSNISTSQPISKSINSVNTNSSHDIKTTNDTNSSIKTTNYTNNVIEKRTVGEYAKDKFNESSVGRIAIKVKRSYQIGKNTGLKYSQKRTDEGESK